MAHLRLTSHLALQESSARLSKRPRWRRARESNPSVPARPNWAAWRKSTVLRIGILSVALLAAASAAIVLVEGREGKVATLGDAIWFGIVTMTTVGYGDVTPTTAAGRAISVILMLGGMALLSTFTATIASIFVTERINKGRGLDVMDKMRDHVLLCGWNEHAEQVLDGLLAAGRDQVVLVNELPEETVNELLLRHRDGNVAYVRGDPAIEAVLVRAGAQHAQAAVVLSDTSRTANPISDERTTLITLALKSIGAAVKVTAEVADAKSASHVRRAGADDVVITGEFNDFLLASAATAPGIPDVVRSLLSRQGGLCRASIPAELVGRSYGEVFQWLHSHRGFIALAIVTESKALTLDDLLTDDHSLVDQFIKQQFSQAGKEFLRFEQSSARVVVNPPDSYIICEQDTAVGITRQ